MSTCMLARTPTRTYLYTRTGTCTSMSGIALALFAAKSTTEEYSARKPSDN